MRWPESPDKLTACRKWLAGCQCNQLDSYLAHMFVQNLEYVKITQQTMSQLKSTSCKLVKMLWLVDAMRNWNIESTLKMIWVYSRAVEYESWSLYIYMYMYNAAFAIRIPGHRMKLRSIQVSLIL